MIYGIVASEYRFAIPPAPVPLGLFDFVNGTYDWGGTNLTAADVVQDDEWIGADGLAITGTPATGTPIIYSGLTDMLATCSWTIVIEVNLPTAQTSPQKNIFLVVSNSGSGYFIEIYYSSGWQADSYDPVGSAATGDFVNALSSGIHKFALTRTNNNLAISVDGNAVESDLTTTGLPVGGNAMVNFYLGNWPSPNSNGRAVNIRSIAIYDVQPDENLPGLSAGESVPPNLAGSGSFIGAGALTAYSRINLAGIQSLVGAGLMSIEGTLSSPILDGTASFVGSGVMSVASSIQSAESAEASAFLARTSGLDSTHTNAYVALINGLVSDGVWSQFDALWVFATQDATTAKLNLVSTSYNMTETGSPTFTADQGYNGSSGNYLSDGAAMNTLTQFQQNSAHIAVWDLTAAGNDGRAIGDSSGDTNIHTKYSDNYAYVKINTSGTRGTVANNKGFYVGSRTSSTNVPFYKNASVLDTGSSTSGARSANNLTVPEGGGGSISTDLIAAASVGGALTATDVTNLYNRLYTYLQAVGISSPT